MCILYENCDVQKTVAICLWSAVIVQVKYQGPLVNCLAYTTVVTVLNGLSKII